MEDILLVLVSFSSQAEASHIGTVLLEKQLIACINYIPGVHSLYRWKGGIENQNEVLAFMKTKGSLWSNLQSEIRELHSYEVPEIMAVKVEFVADFFHQWVLAQLKEDLS